MWRRVPSRNLEWSRAALCDITRRGIFATRWYVLSGKRPFFLGRYVSGLVYGCGLHVARHVMSRGFALRRVAARGVALHRVALGGNVWHVVLRGM